MSVDEFLAQLADLNEDFTWVQLTQAELAEDDLLLTFYLRGATWNGDEVAQTWQITAQGVTEQRLSLGECQFWPELAPDYPRLVVAQSVWKQLMFAAAPADAAALLADLRAIHDEEHWDSFGKYGFGRQVELGYGVFADGPEPLLQQYHAVLEAHKMHPCWLPSAPRPRPPQACLHLGGTVWKDDLYVLAQRFEAQLMPSLSPQH